MKAQDLSQLLALDALLQEGSVTEAADRMSLSVPAMSHALGRLRERLDDPLLVRAGRGMVLTPRAEELKARVKDAVAAAEEVFRAPEPERLEEIERTYTIAVSDYVTTLTGTHLDAEVRRRAPGVNLRLLLNAPDDPERLRAGDIDLAVGIYANLPPEVRTRRVISDHLVSVARENNPLIKKRLTLKLYCELSHIQIAPRGRPGGIVDAALRSRGLSRRVARAVPFFRYALELVASSDFLLTIPRRIAERFQAPLGLRVFKVPLDLKPYALSMVWHPRHDRDPGHRLVRQRLRISFEAAGGLSHEL